MNVKSLILIFFTNCLFNACVSNNITWSANTNIRKVEIGMTKEQVVNILGNKYMIDSALKDEKGNNIQVLGYKSDSSEEYKLKFINNQLSGWNREHIHKYIVQDQSPLGK